MKKRLIVMLAILVLLGSMYSPTKAAAPVTYESSVQVRNLTSTAGTITLTFYNNDGTTAALVGTAVLPIAANESLSFYRSTLPVVGGFKGSMVVSSDVELAGMSNLVGLDGAANRISFGAFSAFSSGSSTVYLPILQANNSGYTSFYSVQNLGSSAATVSIAYSDGVTVADKVIPVGASAQLDQGTEGHTAKVFGGTLTSTQPIAATVSIVGSTLFVYNGVGGGSLMPILPLINTNNSGYVTGVQVMNLGTQASDVTITYTPTSAGTLCTEKRTLAAGESKTFAYYGFFRPEISDPTWVSNCVLGQTFIGSAAVTTNSASQPLAVVVNQLQSADNKGGAYGAFNPAVGGASIIFPLIMDRNSGYYTSWSLTNVGTSLIPAGAISCTVSGKDKVGNVSIVITNPADIPVSGGWNSSQRNVVGDGFVGGATCVGPTGSKLVGMANELGAGAAFAGIDSLLVYEGIIR